MTEHRPGSALAALRAQAERATEVRARLADLVGEATSEDGLVTAQVGSRGLRALTLDPKAMRLPSMDLADSVVAVTARARDDLDTRRRELAAELGADERPDLDESMAQLQRLQSIVESSHGDMRAAFERFRDSSGR